MIVAIDFDGTCVSHEFPEVGKDIGAVPVLKELVEKGHQLILWTMRSDREALNPTGDDFIIDVRGTFLTDAINWFKDNQIPLWGIQRNPTQTNWTTSPKVYAQLYIDDAALGCPLKLDPNISKNSFVDWEKVYELLKASQIL